MDNYLYMHQEHLNRLVATQPRPGASSGINLSVQHEEGSRPYLVNNVGVIPIKGPLCTETSWLSWFGYVSYASIVSKISEFVKDADVSSILLDINSPGGDANSLFELTDFIRSCSKPIYTYTGGDCLSAAYGIAAATKGIVAHKTAFLGSVGVVVMMPNAIDGWKVLTSSGAPKKNYFREQGVDEQIVSHLDELEAHFVQYLSQYRGVEPEYILQNFGQGDVVISGKGIGFKMLDKIGSFDDAIQFASAGAQESNDKNQMKNKKRRATMSKQKLALVLVNEEDLDEGVESVEVTADSIRENFPEVADEIASAESDSEESQMADVVDTVDTTDDEEKAMRAEALNGKMSAVQLATKLLAHRSQKGKMLKLKAARQEDNPGISSAGGTQGKDPKNENVSALAAQVKQQMGIA